MEGRTRSSIILDTPLPSSLSSPCRPSYRHSTSAPSSLDILRSRYRDDFEELRLIGRGAYGSVWHARNKLDGLDYAIKKVCLRPGAAHTYRKVFREIKSMSRLDHPNVVRYYSSWLEYEDTWEEDSLDQATIDSPLSLTADSDSYSEDEEEEDEESHIPGSDLTLFIQMQLCQHTLQGYLKYRNRALCLLAREQALISPVLLVNKEANITLFRKIAQGVAYIHSQGLMHRDLKPGNAAAARQDVHGMVPKIGDFGLVAVVDGALEEEEEEVPIHPPSTATTLPTITSSSSPSSSPSSSSSSSSTSSSASSCTSPTTPSSNYSKLFPFVGPSALSKAKEAAGRVVTRTTNVGTITYAAPEQLLVSSRGYDEKVDVFALGILFLELYHPFETLMERAHVLQGMRQGELPPAFVEQWPREAAFILWMTAQDPTGRPTLRQILEFGLLRSNQDEQSLRAQLRTLQREHEAMKRK
ncbi:MAG: kinase-like domain-containing protein, partial [Piptocephalis tieghemiana]